ncbi:MAG: hypothetical protein AAF961_13520, partial [Planctomycetota bacterium]
MNSRFWRLAVCGILGLCGVPAVESWADQNGDENADESTVTAPPNTREWGNALGGAYYVDKVLLQRYEAVKERLTRVRADIARGAVTSAAAEHTLAEIQEVSALLRSELERKKIFVGAYDVYSQTSEQTFPLGDERLVVMTGDHVVVKGWEGPGIKCVLQKVIVAKQQPDEAEFDAMRVKHELGSAEGMVGKTRQQRDEQEKAFLESAKGRALTDAQRATRKKFVDEIDDSYKNFHAFQGRDCHMIELEGLAPAEGNRNLSLKIESPDGGATYSSQWQRHATLTVYLPPCQAVALRGCLVGLDVQEVECDLVLTTQGSRDRDLQGSFEVRGVEGSVTIDQVPVRLLSQVAGNVTLSATNEFVNSGTHHANRSRTFSCYATHTTRIEHIGGDLQAAFLRTELHLKAIAGLIDVVNEYGTTFLEVGGFDPDRAHRIVSESGAIDVTGPANLAQDSPIYA